MAGQIVLGVEAFDCEAADIGEFVTGQAFGYQTYGEDGTIDMYPADTWEQARAGGMALAARLCCQYQELC